MPPILEKLHCGMLPYISAPVLSCILQLTLAWLAGMHICTHLNSHGLWLLSNMAMLEFAQLCTSYHDRLLTRSLSSSVYSSEFSPSPFSFAITRNTTLNSHMQWYTRQHKKYTPMPGTILNILYITAYTGQTTLKRAGRL